MRYSAFISYNHRDRSWANWLHRQLERYRLPRPVVGREGPLGTLAQRLPPVFQDREELAASTDLAQSIRDALAEAATLIVICSTSGAGSRWVNEEVREFVRLGRRDRIQCLIVPEADDPQGAPRPAADVFPPALSELGEPLAADARRTGDGKRNAFLKLVAGMIGVRYDELRQREQSRRQKRLLALATAASVGFMAMTGLSAFALVSRAEAVRERDIARQKTLTAQRTTDFVKGLFQVSDPSEARGQTITAAEVLDRGARRIRGELDDEPDVKAELMSTLSEVYVGLGSYRRGDELVRESLSLKVDSKETRARQIGVLAASQALQGNYEQADSLFRQASSLLPPPGQLGDQSLYSRLLIGRAESLAALERYPEANRLIAAALGWDRKREGPRGLSVARDYEAAGLSKQFEGELETARRFYASALAIRVASQGRLHPKVSEDLNELGTVAYLQGDDAAAEKYWRQCIALDQQVLGPDHPDVAATLNNLARVMIQQRKFSQALPLLTRSVNINLAERSATHDDLSFIFANLAIAKKGVGARSDAEALFQKALAAAEAHENRLLAPTLVDLANLRCERGDYGSAMQLLDRAAPIMKADYPDDPWRSAWVENSRGACLLRQGRTDAARPLLTGSSPIILKRWPADTLFGFDVQQRMKALAARG